MDPALRMAIRESVFQASFAPYLMLDTDLRIVAANRAYLQATSRTTDTLVGLDMFDAFPDNPEDPEADGAARLRASLEQVLRRRRPHNMVLQRYDIQTPAGDGPFRERTWAPVNSPILDDDGRVVGLLHHVEDVTGLVPGRSRTWSPASWHGLAAGSARLRQAAAGTARANDRLRDALIALVASPGGDGDGSERRRQLWRQVTEQTGDEAWRGWADALCTVAARVVGAGTGVALTAAAGGTVLAADRAPAAELDELQYTLGEGPTWAAMSLAAPVLVGDATAAGHPWAGFAAASASAGRALGGVWAYPIGVGGAVIGALTFYFAGEPPPGAATDAAILADLATTALTIDTDELGWESGSDRATLERSHTLDLATGLVAARLGIGMETARERIRAAALAGAVPLYELAVQILDGRSRLE